MVDRPLVNRVAIVTGGAGGIGGAISRQLAIAGAHVVVNDWSEELANDIATAVTREDGEVTTVVGDIRDLETITRLTETALAVGDGRIDILVNNVGDFRPATKTFLHSDEDQWQTMYDLNLRHVMRCSRAVLPAMVEYGQGAIVSVSTVEAFRGIPGHAAYSAFKAGVIAFTQSLAVEVGHLGVRVNAIAPDLMDTMQTPAAAMLRGRGPDSVGWWVPMGRFGQAEDCGEVVLFLVSDAARFVTGQTIAVDGGTLAASGWYRRADGKGWTNLPDAP